VERDGFVFADLVLRDPGSVVRGSGIREFDDSRMRDS